MSQTPDDILIRRILAWWKLLTIMATGMIGAAVEIHSTLLQSAVDPTGASVGALLLGVPLTAVLENVWRSGGSKEGEPKP